MYEEPVKKPWKIRFKNSFLARWPGYPLVVIIALASYFLGEYAIARTRFFVERDPTLSYPYVDDTVPSWSLALIAGVGPILMIFLAQFLIRRSPNARLYDRRTKDPHLALLVLAEVLAVTYFITNILKTFVGRYRPDFFAYCDYKGYREGLNSGDLTAYLASTTAGAVGNINDCANTIKDSHYSFPSGHSSISFCGLTFLTLFMLHVTSRITFTHHSVGKILRFFIILTPLFSAALIAATRIIDYKHNVDDTIWGALIGILGAVLAFHANYGYDRPVVPGAPVLGGIWQAQISSIGSAHQQPFGDIDMNRVSVPTTGGVITTKSPLVTRVV